MIELNEVIEIMKKEEAQRSGNEALIATSKILEALEEVEMKAEYAKTLEAFIEESEIEYNKADNSFNWQAPITRDFDFKTYEINGESFIALKVHVGLDIRGSYTDYVYLKCHIEEFFEIIHECYEYIPLEVNGEEFELHLSPLHYGIQCYSLDDEELQFEVYELEFEDIKKEINEKLKELRS